MSIFYMTLLRRNLASGEEPRLVAGRFGVWVQSGAVDWAERTVAQGRGFNPIGMPITCRTAASVLCFSVTASPVENSERVMLSASFEWPAGDALFRLDQVNFPPRAQAYRHVHPGAGIRCLIEGQLEIVSDDHTETMNPNDAWFEDANSPVRATAGEAPTAFIRAMILPPEFEGKPTLNILDPKDRTKPRLQTNTRFFDQRITLGSD